MNFQSDFPKISIVTVSLNQGEYIESNIISVLEQNYPNLEHLIIDGGSTDDTLEILKKYDTKLNWVSEPDNGQSHALNKGFKKATGDIVGWVNSDDKLYPGALEKVSSFFVKNPNAVGVVGDLAMINECGEVTEVLKSRSYDFHYLVNKALGITQASTFFNRRVFDEIGYLDESLNFVMDRDLFIRVTSLGDIIYIPEILAQFRIQPQSKTSLGTHKFCRELVGVRRKYGANWVAPGILNDIYVIWTQPLRRISPLRRFVQSIKRLFKPVSS